MMTAILLLVLAAGPPVCQMSEPEVDAYLAQLQAAQPDLGVRIIDVARRSVGTPYASGPLGEGPEGKYDKDPLMDLKRVDCVTFVEQTLALAASKSYQAAFDALQRIRYRNGQVDFETRNHFMITDWIANNTFCKDVSKDLGGPTATVTRTISRREFFKKMNAPELGQDTPDKVVELAYVPLSAAGDAARKLPSPAVVVFVGKVEWLFALHCGLFIRDEKGNGQLYHASSKVGCVTATGFTDYLQEQSSRYLGFTAYEIGEPVGRR